MRGRKTIYEYNDGSFEFTIMIYDDRFRNGEGEIIGGSFETRDGCDKAAMKVIEAFDIELID